MERTHAYTVADRRKRARRVSRAAFGISVTLHLLFLLALGGSVLPPSPFAAPGPATSDDLAAAGSMQAMNIRTPPTRPLIPPPIPRPTLEPIDPVEYDEEAAIEPPQVLGDAPGVLEAPGTSEGMGAGAGGAEGVGRSEVTPPQMRGLVIPPNSRKLKGKAVEVWVFVDERGRVIADSTRLSPPTSDRRFNQQLIEGAADWAFRPAQKGGVAVASWYSYTFSVSGS